MDFKLFNSNTITETKANLMYIYRLSGVPTISEHNSNETIKRYFK